MFALSFAFADLAGAQLLSTGDSLEMNPDGSARHVVVASHNLLVPVDGASAVFTLSQYIRSINNRMDFAIGLGNCSLVDRNQRYNQANVLVGVNVHLYTFKRPEIAVATYQLVGAGLNDRQHSSGAWTYSAAVASRNFRHKGTTYSPYIGYALTKPWGKTEGVLYTSVEPVYNWIPGLAIDRGRFTIFGEYNGGAKLRAYCFAVAYKIKAFKKK